MKIKAKNIWVEYEIFGFTMFFLSVFLKLTEIEYMLSEKFVLESFTLFSGLGFSMPGEVLKLHFFSECELSLVGCSHFSI